MDLILPNSTLKGKVLKNNAGHRPIFINGMKLTNANGAIDIGSTGFDYLIRTTSYIRKSVVQQKFYEIAPADYVPVSVGEGAWKEEIVQNATYDLTGSFYEGDVDTMTGNGKISEVNTVLAPNRIPTQIWARGASWSVSEVATASANGDWDIVESKMKTLKKNWDLGIQETAFLGHPIRTAMTGLLNNGEVTINTTLISKPLSTMTETEYTAFIGAVLSTYFANSNSTVMPDTFVMPTSDYLGMARPYSETYPLNSKLSYLQKTFEEMTLNPNFKILPLSYSEAAQNASRGINKNRYILYRNLPDTMKMDIPVDFTLYDPGTANNIYWQQPAMGQYSGVLINRAPEVLYIDETV